MKNVVRILPCSRFDPEAIGAWLSAQAHSGLILERGFLYFATFAKQEPQDYVYILNEKGKRIYAKGWNYIGRKFGYRTYVATTKNAEESSLERPKSSIVQQGLRLLLNSLFVAVLFYASYQIACQTILLAEFDVVLAGLALIIVLPYFLETIDLVIHLLPIKYRKRFNRIEKIKNAIVMVMIACSLVSIIAADIYIIIQVQKIGGG